MRAAQTPAFEAGAEALPSFLPLRCKAPRSLDSCPWLLTPLSHLQITGFSLVVTLLRFAQLRWPRCCRLASGELLLLRGSFAASTPRTLLGAFVSFFAPCLPAAQGGDGTRGSFGSVQSKEQGVSFGVVEDVRTRGTLAVGGVQGCRQRGMAVSSRDSGAVEEPSGKIPKRLCSMPLAKAELLLQAA